MYILSGKKQLATFKYYFISLAYGHALSEKIDAKLNGDMKALLIQILKVEFKLN
jgi:hypothetical protein